MLDCHVRIMKARPPCHEARSSAMQAMQHSCTTERRLAPSTEDDAWAPHQQDAVKLRLGCEGGEPADASASYYHSQLASASTAERAKAPGREALAAGALHHRYAAQAWHQLGTPKAFVASAFMPAPALGPM